MLKYPLIDYPVFTEELSDLLMDEYQFSLMRIVSDVEIIDGNPWWCKDFGTLNRPQPLFVENWTHICYPTKLFSDSDLMKTGKGQKYHI